VTDLQQLHRAILLDPSDDVARLAYADALEEQGGDTHAEFIRLQIELWRKNQPGPVAGSVMTGSTVVLYERQDELARGFSWRWLGSTLRHEVIGKARADGPATVWRSRLGDSTAEFRRGFVWEVGLMLAEFMLHATDLFSTHPVTSVVLMDCHPVSHDGCWVWYDTRHTWHGTASILRQSYQVPAEQFGHFPGSDHGNQSRLYPDEPSARRAFSAACVAYGRSLAGLPPLPV
jgi:uncharacterized protein (TIGR02996 family)